MPADSDASAFVMTRQFDRSLAVVWQAWSEAEHLKQWWGPQGCTISIGRFEFRPGGFFHYSMNFAGVPAMWGRFNYREIIPQQRLVWLNAFANERCGIARAPFSADCPLEVENTVTLTEQDGKTTIALRAVPFGALDAERKFFEDLRPSLEQGYGGTFDQLRVYLDKA